MCRNVMDEEERWADRLTSGGRQVLEPIRSRAHLFGLKLIAIRGGVRRKYPSGTISREVKNKTGGLFGSTATWMDGASLDLDWKRRRGVIETQERRQGQGQVLDVDVTRSRSGSSSSKRLWTPPRSLRKEWWLPASHQLKEGGIDKRSSAAISPLHQARELARSPAAAGRFAVGQKVDAASPSSIGAPGWVSSRRSRLKRRSHRPIRLL